MDLAAAAELATLGELGDRPSFSVETKRVMKKKGETKQNLLSARGKEVTGSALEGEFLSL